MTSFVQRAWNALMRRVLPPWRVLKLELRVLMSRRRWLPLDWEPIEDNPVERVEPAQVRCGSKWYVIGGYITLDSVHSGMEVLDLKTGRWVERIDMPETIAQTHCGVIGEADRYLYFCTGQVGIQCSPAVRDCHVFDTETHQWSTLPPLPENRYAPVTVIWDGRLHVMSGSKEDRVTPADDHWSIAVREGRALEDAWREEVPCPIGGPHRAFRVVDDVLYLLGAQHYDRPAIPGDPTFTCDWGSHTRQDVLFSDCYCMDRGAREWTRLENIPIPVSHAEFSTFVHGDRVFVLGGFFGHYNASPIIQAYDTKKNQWAVVGRMPWGNKGLVAEYYDGWLYVALGQKSISRWNAGFGDVIKSGYRAKVDLDAAW